MLDKWIAKLNKHQKIVLAFSIPILLLLLTLYIAGRVGYDSGNFYNLGPHPFNIEKTWWVWCIFILICTIVEFKIFQDKRP